MLSNKGITEVTTLPETNIDPENRSKRPKKGKTSIPSIHFQVRLLLVSGRVSSFNIWDIPVPPRLHKS